MTNISTVENKISSVKKYLKICHGYRHYSKNEIENDIDVRGKVERYLFLAVQATIDLAECYISFKKHRKPSSMSEAFYILEEEGVIKKDLTKNMVNMIGFRNILTHDYDKINYDIVYNVLHKGLNDIKIFLKNLNI